MSSSDDASMQAECIVQALDAYLATFPWPAPSVHSGSAGGGRTTGQRQFLVDTLAASLRMSEPRKSELNKV